MPLAHQIKGMADTARPDPEAVQQALMQILASSEFRASPRLSAFLTFCVGRSVEGKADTLKAYTIATQVFMRPDHFDPQADPIVRVEATRLRRAMQRYYGQEGADDPLHLHMERGQYGVSFIVSNAPAAQGQGIPQLSISLLEKLAAIAEGSNERRAPPVTDMSGLAVSGAPVPAVIAPDAAAPDQPAPTLRLSLAALPLDLKLVLLGLTVLAAIFIVAWYNVPPPIVTQKPDKALAAKAGLTARAFQPAKLTVVAETSAPELGVWVEDLRDALSRFDAIIVLDAGLQGDKRNGTPDFQLAIRKTGKGSLMLRLVMAGTGEIIWSKDIPPGTELAQGQVQGQVQGQAALSPWLTELAAWDGLINRRHWSAPQFERIGANEELPCQHQAMRALLAQQLDLVHGAQACFDKDLASGLSWSKPQWRLRLDLMALTLGDTSISAATVAAEAQRHIRQSPLSASVYGLAGQSLLLAGQGDEARAMLAKARRLNPYDLSFDRP